jgi:hypothetical protein
MPEQYPIFRMTPNGYMIKILSKDEALFFQKDGYFINHFNCHITMKQMLNGAFEITEEDYKKELWNVLKRIMKLIITF